MLLRYVADNTILYTVFVTNAITSLHYQQDLF